MIGERLFVLLACLFVVMIGFGITLPVLPVYVDRLAQAEGATREAIVLHVTLLTAVHPLGQLAFALVWGTLVRSNRPKATVANGTGGVCRRTDHLRSGGRLRMASSTAATRWQPDY